MFSSFLIKIITKMKENISILTIILDVLFYRIIKDECFNISINEMFFLNHLKVITKYFF